MTMLLEFLERHRARHLFRSSHLKMARIRSFSRRTREDTCKGPEYSVIEIKREYARENVTWHLNEKKNKYKNISIRTKSAQKTTCLIKKNALIVNFGKKRLGGGPTEI